nr:ATP-binding protein [uncultured Bdellovibrio sp.]
MTHRSRLFLFTASLVLGTLLVAGIVGYQMGVSSLLEGTQEKLVQIRQFKTKELQKDFSYLNDSLLATAEEKSLKDFFQRSPQDQEQIRSWLRSHGSESAWRSIIIRANSNPEVSELSRVLGQMSPSAVFLQAHFIQEAVAQNKMPHEVIKSSNRSLSYFKSHELLHPSMTSLWNRLELSDVILIDPKGNVVYTVKKELDMGANLLSGTFANSRLAQAFRWSMNASQGATKFFDFSPLTHFWSLPVGFLVTPLFSQSSYIGTLVFQIPIERVDAILSNQHDWESLGLRKTGEVVAFGSDGLMRNNARAFFESPDKFLSSYQKHESSVNNAELVRRSHSTALSIGLPQDDLKNYLQNHDIIETTTDYAGNKAVQSVGKAVLPGNTEWIIIAKVSAQEALVPLTNKILPLVLFILVIGALALASAYIFSRRMFQPLQSLNQGLQKLASLDFSEKLPEQRGEFKNLSDHFHEVSRQLSEIKTQKDFLENTVQSIHEAFFVVEISHSVEDKVHIQIRDLNPAASEMLGLAAASLKGTDLQMWIDTDYSQILSSLENHSESTQALSMEGTLKKISGEKIPLDLSWALLKNSKNSHPTLVVVGRDIRWKKEIEKELKLKEELLKESQSLSKTGSFRWDISTGKCLWSEEEFHILGLDPATTLPTFELFRSLILSEDLEIFDDALHEAHQNIQPFNLDFRLKKKDTGDIIWVRAQGRTEYDDYGNPLFMYGTTQDITELRRVEQSLIAAKNDALKSSQAKSEFLARMSHEIRTPMNAIMGMAELLKETKLNQDQQYYVTIFCKAGEVLMALINDILDLSKIEAGEVSIENIPFDLKKLMIDVEEMMKPRALEKGINYSFEMTPGISPYLMGDPNKLRQVLINLVSNSLKFTETGYIRVSVSKNPSKKDTLMVSVSDSGVGIPSNKQHLIFQKFSQADSSITRRYGGTGLGLAISKSLVELMGGQIWFKSRENMGTTFFFTIPYREQVYNPVTHKPLHLHGGEMDFLPYRHRDPNKKIRILIADDTEDNRTLFTHYLKNGPYEIIEAENGLEALDKIKSGQFDIVFMDVQMPEMDGYAATDKIRKWEDENHKQHTPIIALTAHALSEDRQKSLRAGCDDHIAKPFKKDTLLGVINRYSL